MFLSTLQTSIKQKDLEAKSEDVHAESSLNELESSLPPTLLLFW